MKIKDLANLPEVRIFLLLLLSRSSKCLLQVLSLGANNTFVPAAATAHLQQGRRECIELLFSDGRKLICTPEHRIRTTDGWCEAGALVMGQEVMLGVEGPLYDPAEDNPVHLAAFQLELTELAPLHMSNAAGVARAHAFARILGSLYTDGSAHERADRNAYNGSLCVGHRIDADQAVKDLALVLGKNYKVKEPADAHNYYTVRA